MHRYNNILVMGAGAVGGYFGGRIAERTSARVTFIARGRHLASIRERGLTVLSPDGNSLIEVEAYEDPREAASPDLILFTVKSYDTEEAVERIAPVVSTHTQILTIQNGIENYPRLVRAFGSKRVIQGICRIGAAVPEPGTVHHSAMGSITIGEPDGKPTIRTKQALDLFSQADIPCTISPNIGHEVWTKFAWNAVFNMLTALGNVTLEKLFEHGAIEEVCHSLFEEIRRVAATQGVQLTAEEERKMMEGARKLIGFETSTYQDRKKGKRLEYEAFTGAVVRLAEKHNIDVSVNRTIYGLLKLIDR